MSPDADEDEAGIKRASENRESLMWFLVASYFIADLSELFFFSKFDFQLKP